MKLRQNINKGVQRMRFLVAFILLNTLAITALKTPAFAQGDTVQFTPPTWWIGGAAAANGNQYRGSTQQLSGDFKPPTAFHDGMGIGLYAAPSIEFHKPNAHFGLMLQVGYDNRSSKFDQIITPCNCPADLTTRLSYLTIEPSLRFAPFKKGLYLYAGPRLAFNLKKEFTYQQGTNPAYPEQIANEAVKGNFSSVNDSMLSMQIGVGYDFPIFSQHHRTQMVVSPFVAFHPYFGQNPRSIETWNISTLRVGANVKFGFGKSTNKVEEAAQNDKSKEAIATKETTTNPENTTKPENTTNTAISNSSTAVAGSGETAVVFTVDSPENIPDKRVVSESFPLTNYVFFGLNSTTIPERYVQINQTQVAAFKEDKVELYTPANLSGRSDRQMIVYYNVLNILGNRMVKYPKSYISLTGASHSGEADGILMAQSIKDYLVHVFGINASRITTNGALHPLIPSEQPGGTLELVRLREEDRRVTIASNSPELLMEYQSGPAANLKPVEIVAAQTAPIESYVTFHAKGASEEFSSWKLEVKDDAGLVTTYGPYETDDITMPGKKILGSKPRGDYKVTMIGTTKKKNQEVKLESNIHMVLWTPSEKAIAHKYSVIYGFNQSNAIEIYDKYIREVVVPAIPQNGTVIIHGYTDDIGDANSNKLLSLARANDVQSTIKSALATAGRTDVKFTVYGFGENDLLVPFDNIFPEGRLYNRAVIIEIVPKN